MLQADGSIHDWLEGRGPKLTLIAYIDDATNKVYAAFREQADAARKYLAEVGCDPDFGARPLKRAIQRELQDPLALRILSGEFSEGDTIRVDSGKDELVFSVGKPFVEEE